MFIIQQLIAQILLARNLNFLLELWRFYLRIDNVEWVERCLDEYLVDLVEEVFDSIILSVMYLVMKKISLNI